jgi:hypothetical protein
VLGLGVGLFMGRSVVGWEYGLGAGWGAGYLGRGSLGGLGEGVVENRGWVR